VKVLTHELHIRREKKIEMVKNIFLLVVIAGLLVGLTCKKDNCTTCPPMPTDSTSHDFVFQQYYFGESGSSIFYDVAIVSEDPPLAYAVGAVYTRDSLGKADPDRYNAAVWNGVTWTLKRITVNFRGNLITPPVWNFCLFG
jgi:hypothetical protein